ncbi:MAG TPA: Gfo/Idh/MocA family oxidoreductase [Solirubrobacteraceae bacterium]
MTPQPVRVGIVGGGFMGRTLAVTLARWSALEDHPAHPQLVAACDTDAAALRWFDRIESVITKSTDYHDLLDDDAIDVLYLAVPHHLHESLYLDAVAAGKDFLGEKPFGIDLAAAERIVAAIEEAGVFVRCSSELPFFPGAQLAYETIAAGALGQMIEVEHDFLHSSDLDRTKPINWKRQARFCGAIGVMGDLGMHVAHVPLRLGWRPASVYAVLSNLVPERPYPRTGEPVPCDTIDNAALHCDAGFPLTLRTYRIAPGHMNTWRITATGMDGGVAFSTAQPKTVHRFAVRDGRQVWERFEVGSQSVFPTVSGPIFEFGFEDAILQMWAAYLAERAGALGDRFGCATPREALDSHHIFAAALRSAETHQAEPVGGASGGHAPA